MRTKTKTGRLETSDKTHKMCINKRARLLFAPRDSERHVSSLDRHRLLRGRPTHSALCSAPLKFPNTGNSLIFRSQSSDVATKAESARARAAQRRSLTVRAGEAAPELSASMSTRTFCAGRPNRRARAHGYRRRTQREPRGIPLI